MALFTIQCIISTIAIYIITFFSPFDIVISIGSMKILKKLLDKNPRSTVVG
jgi:hypothetical protein